MSMLLLCACERRVESAFKLKVEMANALKADCLEVAVLVDGVKRKSVVVPRESDSTSYVVGIRRGDDLPATVGIMASGLLGPCDDETKRKPNSISELSNVKFPAVGVSELALSIGPPSSLVDKDQDGYLSSSEGGPDCNDASVAAFPGAIQLCTQEDDNDCDGRGACDDTECGAALDCIEPPDRVTVTGLPHLMLRHDCSGPITVELLNSRGPRGAVRTTAVSLSSSLPNVTFHANNDCSDAPQSTAIVAFKQTKTTVYVSGNAVGVATISFGGAGLATTAGLTQFRPQPVSKLEATMSTSALEAGACSTSPVTIQLLDSANRLTTVEQDLNIALEATPAEPSGNFFTDSSCSPGSRITSGAVGIKQGEGQATIYLRALLAGPLTFNTSTSIQAINYSDTVSLIIKSAAASQLVFSNMPLSVRTSEACSPGKLIIESKDAHGNIAPLTSALTVSFSSGNLVSFFGDSACAAASPSTTIPQGGSRIELYVRGTTLGAGTVTASSSLGSAIQPIAVSSGPPVALAFELTPQLPIAGDCSGALTVKATDAQFYAASFDKDVSIQFTASPTLSNFSFYSNATCSTSLPSRTMALPKGESQLQVYFRGTTASSLFSIAANVITPVTPSVTSSTIANNMIRPGPPFVLTWAPTGATIDAGQCADFTFSVRDRFDNLTSFMTAGSVTLSATPAGNVGFGTASCSSNLPLTLPANTQSLAIKAGSTSSQFGSHAIAATVSGVSTTATATLNINPAAYHHLKVDFPVTGAASLTAGSCQKVTVSRRDLFENPVPVSSNTNVSLTTSLGSGLSFFASQSNCEANSGSTSSVTMLATQATRDFYVRAIVAGTSAVQATVGAFSATATLTVSPAAVAKYVFVNLPANRSANQCTGAVQVQRRDQFDNNVVDGNTSVTISSTGTMSFTTSSDCGGASSGTAIVAIPNGSSLSATFSAKSIVPGTYTFSASDGSKSGTATMTVQPGSPAKLSILGTGSTTRVAECKTASGIEVELRDAFDNPVAPGGSGLSVTLSASSGAAFYAGGNCGGSSLSSISIASTATKAAFSFRANVVTASLAITASSGGLSPGNQTWQVLPGDPSKLAFLSTPPSTLPRFNCSGAVTVETRDDGGNPTPVSSALSVSLASSNTSAGLSFFSDSTCSTAIPNTTVASGASTSAPFYLRANGSGTTTFTSSATGYSAVSSDVTVIGTQGTLAVSVGSTLEAGGCNAVTITRANSVDVSGETKGTTPLSISSDSLGAVTLHTAPECGGNGVDPLSISIPSGSASLVVYARGRSTSSANLGVTITATDTSGGHTVGTQSLTTYPLVRRGNCSLAQNDTTRSCTVSIPGGDISRSFVVFSSTGNPNDSSDIKPTNQNVECHLVSNIGTAYVVCTRGNSTGSMSVEYQVVSWGRSFSNGGISVQHVSGALASMATTVDLTLSQPVATSNAFVLFSSKSLDGAINDASHFATAALIDASTVRVTRNQTAAALWVSAQVVEFSNARVDRSTTSGSGSSVSVASLPSRPTERTFALYSAYLGATNNNHYICKRRFRGNIASSQSLLFSRGAGSSDPECSNSDITSLAWERVELPTCSAITGCNTVQRWSAGIAAGTTSIASVAIHRSLALLGGQGPGGQCAGETSWVDTSSATGSSTAAVHATIQLTSETAMSIVRNDNAGTSLFSPFVVQFDP